MIIGLDFDGTVVEHFYPEVGDGVPGCLEWLARLAAEGAKFILWTMRCDSAESGPVLTNAVAYLERNGVALHGINANPHQDWSRSPKAYCNVYVDDNNACCPLVEGRQGRRPMVDWSVVGPWLLAKLREYNSRKPG